MNQFLFPFLALVFICNSPIEYAIGGDTEVKVNVNNIIVERERSLIGANIEDINFQLYGGLYSQLIHGECFEEHVDPSELLGLNRRDRLAVWVIMDEQNRPILTYNAGTSLIYNNGRSVTGLYGSDGLSFGRRAIDVRNPKLGLVHFLDSMLQHGSICFTQNIWAHMDRVIGVNSHDVYVVCSVMNFAKA